MRLVVGEAGLGAITCSGGRVHATGGGWAWIDWDGRPVHLTDLRGPMTPLTARVARFPHLEVGSQIALDTSRAVLWRSPPVQSVARPEAIRDACTSVAAHRWNDPWALQLVDQPVEALLPRLLGRGPGLTPAGDDVLIGFILARQCREESALILAGARNRSGQPSRAFLRWASKAEGPAVAVAMLHALVAADAQALGPALRNLLAFGGTTGSAILTGLTSGLEKLASPPVPGATPDHHPTSA